MRIKLLLLTKHNVSITIKSLHTQEDPYMEFAVQLVIHAKLDVDVFIKAELDKIQKFFDCIIILCCHYTTLNEYYNKKITTRMRICYCSYFYCHDPSFGLATKARAWKGAG
jgi:hypothetical protein